MASTPPIWNQTAAYYFLLLQLDFGIRFGIFAQWSDVVCEPHVALVVCQWASVSASYVAINPGRPSSGRWINKLSCCCLYKISTYSHLSIVVVAVAVNVDFEVDVWPQLESLPANTTAIIDSCAGIYLFLFFFIDKTHSNTHANIGQLGVHWTGR